MRLRVIAVVVAAAIVAALSVTSVASAATGVGPLVLRGPTTIQTDGANIVSFVFHGGPLSPWDFLHSKVEGMPRPPGVTDLVVTKPVDGSSPALLKAAALGTEIKQAFLAWGDGVTQQSLCLEDVVVSSVQTGSGSGAVPLEAVYLTYVRVGLDPQGTAACEKLGPPPPATVTTALKGGTFYARVACLSARCDGVLSLRLPSGACARAAGIMPPDRACAGRTFRVGRVGLAEGRVRVLRLGVAPGRLRRVLARLTAGTARGIIAVLQRGSRRPVTLTTIPGDAKPKLPSGLPAVQSTPVTAPPAPGPVPSPPGAPGPVATTLAITTCGPVGQFPREFAGQVTPAVAGLSITMTYTPPAPGAVISQTVTTNAAGQFSDAVAAATPGTWSAAAGFAGNAGYGASTSPSCDFLGG